MKRHLVTAIAAVYGCLAALAGAQAADPIRNEPIGFSVQLGTASGDLVISPRDLTFERGKYYKLVLKNSSDVEHRLSVASFASSVRTYGTLAIDRGTVIGRPNFKGRVPSGYLPRVIEVAPGGVAEWNFVPLYHASARVGCTIDDHAEVGMMAKFGVI